MNFIKFLILKIVAIALCLVNILTQCKKDNYDRLLSLTIREATINTAESHMEISVVLNKTLELTPVFMPRDYPDKSIYYNFSKGQIASVTKDDVLQGLALGSDTLTISANGIQTHYIIKVVEK